MSGSIQTISAGSEGNVVSCEELFGASNTHQSEAAHALEKARVERNSQNHDLVLFLREPEGSQSEALLALLIYRHAQPVIRNVIRSRLRVSFSQTDGGQSNQDAFDIENDVHTLLLTQLRSIKARPQLNPISNFSSYVAAVTYHACYRHLRLKYPQRTRLKNRVRYLITRSETFDLWETPEKEWLCGLQAWRAPDKKPARAGRLQELLDNPSCVEALGLTVNAFGPTPDADALKAIFKWAGGPVELDWLVTIVSNLFGIKDEVAQAQIAQDDDMSLPEIPDGSDLSAEVEQRHYLRRLWAEVCQLPLRQRAALLLNLRDSQGRGVVALLPLTGVASMRHIAEILELPAETFAALWNELPLEDVVIGEHLGVTRQQVVNLRKCARQRLARRMRDF